MPLDGGPPIDLSYLDAHKVDYIHSALGKDDITYTFWVTYSFHCFAKEYVGQSAEEKDALMYYAGKDQRPFCYRRHALAKSYLRQIVEKLGNSDVRVIHAGFGSYATAPVVDESGNKVWYFVPFKVYRSQRKFRLHVTSAYPLLEKPGGGKVGFFTLAHNLKTGRALPTENHCRL
ncbi:hypothetical protein EV682_109144 [Iodobacter fluviatilis]|uniref:Heat shock protein C n=1 Tax=Iodobacter fluviatilis TaxID=537 RepID=A0A377Q5Q3_9NEIS|nr:hypothetical protein EV682_109144 [Iodobacter fluviatilis]STQ90085.1 Heat shock protein C [Iodobacter fluviatilis]